MASSSAISQIVAAYKIWGRDKGKNPEPLISLMADDGTFRSIGGGAEPMVFTRTHSTQEKVRSYFSELARDWEMIFYNVRKFLVSGDTVAVVCECAWKHKGTGKIVHTPKLDILRLRRGRITDFFEFFDNHQALTACVAGGNRARPETPAPIYSGRGPKVVSGSTPETRDNLKKVKGIYKDWSGTKGGSADSMIAALAPNASWGSLADGAGPYGFTKLRKSREEVADYFRGLAESITILEYRVEEYLAAGDFILALIQGSFIYKPTGKRIDMPKADLWRFSRGKATEFFEYYDTAAVMAAAKAP